MRKLDNAMKYEYKEKFGLDEKILFGYKGKILEKISSENLIYWKISGILLYRMCERLTASFVGVYARVLHLLIS